MEEDKFPIHVATENRQENIFNLLFEMNVRSKMHSGNVTRSGTIMHLAAKLAPFPQLSSVSGAALQMQREMKWFKVLGLYIYIYKFTFLFYFPYEVSIVSKRVFFFFFLLLGGGKISSPSF